MSKILVSRRERNHILTSIAINARQNMWTGDRKSCNDYMLVLDDPQKNNKKI
jgi:hypothetical protein